MAANSASMAGKTGTTLVFKSAGKKIVSTPVSPTIIPNMFLRVISSPKTRRPISTVNMGVSAVSIPLSALGIDLPAYENKKLGMPVPIKPLRMRNK